MSVPVESWRWHGVAAHFICGYRCRFHLATEVGAWLVSTVGDLYDTDEGERRPLGCDADSFYETYVFHLGDAPKRCEEPGCDCGLPEPTEWCEVYGKRSATRGAATREHLAACAEYASTPSRRAPAAPRE